MTVFGIDSSDFDWSRGPMDVGAMARDGIQFFTHKATEGTSLRHAHYGAALTRARDAGIPVLGAYHVVRSLGALSSQVKSFTGYLDEATPWWRSHPNFLLQVDLERWPYDDVAGSTGTAFADLLAQATGKTVVIYASKGQYGNSLAGSRPLWNAAYPSSTAGHYRELYPGDGGTGWQSYSGRTPIFWQYTSSATIGGQHGCDANAFRGTLSQLLALTGLPAASSEVFMALSDQQQQDLWEWLALLVDPGTPATGRKSDRFHFPPTLMQLKADVDALKAAASAPVPVVLTAEQITAVATALAGLVPTVEELRGIVDAAVKARLDGATVHTAGA